MRKKHVWKVKRMKVIQLPIKLQDQTNENESVFDCEKERLKKELELFTEELRRYFSVEEIEKIARDKKFVRRDGKLKAWQILNLCCFDNIDVANNTLIELATQINLDGGKVVSSQAIDQRLNERCVEFLKTIFRTLLDDKISKQTKIKTELDTVFNRIRILDSTSFQVSEDYKNLYPGSGGSANRAGVKIQLEYELKSGEFLHMEAGPGSSSDSKFGKDINDTIEANDLILRDLGYFSIEEFKKIEEKEAFYISRLKPNVATYVINDNIEYFKNGLQKKSSTYKRINIKDVMSKMKPGETLDIKEIYIGRDNKFKTRLILYKLTEKQLEERIEKTIKEASKKGIKKSSNTIDLLGVTMYITNVPDEILSAEEVYEIYTLRWNIEILFKTWKSIFNLDELKEVKLERFQCQLYGKLILLIVSSTLMFKVRRILLINKEKEISEIKLSQIISIYTRALYISIIRNSFFEVVEILLKIYSLAFKNAIKTRKKGKKTVFEIIKVQRWNIEKAA